VSERTSGFSKGDLVQPGRVLCDLRPELSGELGQIYEVEHTGEVVVQWHGHRRRYRLAASLLEKGT